MTTLGMAPLADRSHPVQAPGTDVGRIEWTGGFYPEEGAGCEPFRWMRAQGVLTFAPAAADRFLELAALSEFHDLSQELTIGVDGRAIRVDLARGWMPIATVIPAGAARVDLSVNKLFPREYHPRDSRELSIRLRETVLHDDAARHRRVAGQQANIVANGREMLDGLTTLASTPPCLGIDMCGVCNVNPPCVYCEWDWSKRLEGGFVNASFTLDTLRAWGPLFDQSVRLVNCSIGEPFMAKNVDELLDAFSDGGKYLEVTTNGQILTDRNIRRLLGRKVDLLISLDAATPETYAKLRNTRFESILDNLRRLIKAKDGPGRWPRVNLVFMPMKVNLHELDGFVEICADLQVDRVVLRPLNYSDKLELNCDRAGYRFEYQRELLPLEELFRASGRASELCRRAGIELSNQMEFAGSFGVQFDQWFEEGRASVARRPGQDVEPRDQPSLPAHDVPECAPRVLTETILPSLGADRTPACTEPWQSLYILRRGVFPCCFGSVPVAPMDQYGGAWNSPLMQAIRGALASGRFHDYCLQSQACPIVRKSLETHHLRFAEAFRMRRRHVGALLRRRAWRPFERIVWSRVRWAGQFTAIRLTRFATDPGYVPRLLKRVLQRVMRAVR